MSTTKIKVCIAGATGWAGSELSKAIIKSDEFTLASGVSRTHAGANLSDVLHISHEAISIFGTVDEALKVPCDVLVEYTKPDVAKTNIVAALNKNVHVVVGTSGLTDEDYLEIDALARSKNRGVLAVGNFAITVALLNKFASIAAKHINHWEIIDYANAGKIDAPSGSARELANRLKKIGESHLDVPIEKINGLKESRGARLNGSQVHAVRLPGFVISLEAIFGMPDEKLTIRHDAGSSAMPYVGGALLAIKKVGTFTGLKRGLESVMDF